MADEARASLRVLTPTAPLTRPTASRSCRSARSETETGTRCGATPRASRRPAAAAAAEEARASPQALTPTARRTQPTVCLRCRSARAETGDRGRETRDDGSPARGAKQGHGCGGSPRASRRPAAAAAAEEARTSLRALTPTAPRTRPTTCRSCRSLREPRRETEDERRKMTAVSRGREIKKRDTEERSALADDQRRRRWRTKRAPHSGR